VSFDLQRTLMLEVKAKGDGYAAKFDLGLQGRSA